jgi:hypothetical protein
VLDHLVRGPCLADDHHFGNSVAFYKL